jgi:hypothetical protein
VNGIRSDFHHRGLQLKRQSRADPSILARLGLGFAPSTPKQDAQRFIDEQGKDERRSFCGKRPFETSARFFQSANAARKCADCIAQFNRKLRDNPPSVD